jgi:hypothetical protein
LNADGSLNFVIPPELTPEQRRERDTADRKRVEERERERYEQSLESRRDSLVLRPESTFENIDTIEQHRRRSLENQQVLIDRANQYIEKCGRERNFLVPDPYLFPEGIPDDARNNVDLYKLCIEQQENAVAAVQLKMQQINAHYDAEINRHRKLQEMQNPSKAEEQPPLGPALPVPATSQ